jgi:hypothetical protein
VRRILLALCLLAVSLTARAENDDDDGAPPAATDDRLRTDESVPPAPEGSYRGVAPGAANLPPHPPKLPLKKGPQRLTWSGFQVREGVPTVFVELTGAPDYHVSEAPGALTVTLRNTVVPIKNNRRPLRVGYFNTPVREVEARNRGRDVQLVVHTKDKERPTHRERVEPAAGGFHLLVIELGAAQSSSR